MAYKILDVGGGHDKYPGSMSIDFNPAAKPDILHDLNKTPWPFKDNEFDMVYSARCIEHLLDPQKIMDEIYRIAKPNARILIILPHFSSRLAWTDIEHKHAFCINSFRRYTGNFPELNTDKVRLEIRRIKFQWQPEIAIRTAPDWLIRIDPVIRILDKFISGLANANVQFCERIWCFYVGGMGEVLFDMKALK